MEGDSATSSVTSNTEKKESTKERGFEYLDHTADVQLHSWGTTIEQAYEEAAIAMMNYMVELDNVEINEECTVNIEVEGHDYESLLFAFLDEFLFQFSTEFIVFKEIKIVEFDKVNWKIKAIGKGEKLNKKKHKTGTEIKAITYSNMQVHQHPERCEVYVIVDI